MSNIWIKLAIENRYTYSQPSCHSLARSMSEFLDYHLFSLMSCWNLARGNPPHRMCAIQIILRVCESVRMPSSCRGSCVKRSQPLLLWHRVYLYNRWCNFLARIVLVSSSSVGVTLFNVRRRVVLFSHLETTVDTEGDVSLLSPASVFCLPALSAASLRIDLTDERPLIDGE